MARLVPALALALLAAGCADTSGTAVPAASGPPSNAAQQDICALLTTADASRDLGVPVAPGTRGVGAQANCSWRAVAGGPALIVIQSDPLSFESALQGTPQPGFTLSRQSDVGDAAYYFTSQGATILEVKQGSFYFTVSALDSHGWDVVAERSAALQVVAHISNTI